MEAIDLEEVRSHKSKVSTQEIRHIKERFSHVIRRMRQSEREIVGHPHSTWLGFNQVFGGARGELITITADTGVGKSTFARNWLKDTVEQGRRALLVSLEDPINAVTECFSQMIARKDIRDFSDDDAKTVGESFLKWPLYYLDHQGPLSESLLAKLLDYSVEELGVNFIMIDHLDYIEKEWSRRNESYVIGDTMRRLAGKSHQHDITIVLIVHPAKLDVKGTAHREVGLDELKGSSSIKQESDAVFGLFRPNPQVAEAYLRFLKIRNHRFSKNVKGKLRFGFDPVSLEWWEVTGSLEWGE